MNFTDELKGIKAAIAKGVDAVVSMRFVLNFLVRELGESEGRKNFEWYCSTYNLSIADNANATIKREVFGL